MKDDDVIDWLQEHFDYLDRTVVRALPNGDHSQRGPIVMALPLLDRDLYFVWDGEEQMEKDLYEHLLAARFSFQRPSPE